MSETHPIGEFLLYETEDGRTRVECRFLDDSIWLTQALMANCTPRQLSGISRYFDPKAPGKCAARSTTTTSAPSWPWATGCAASVARSSGAPSSGVATERLREYLIKGFTLDDERLKNPQIDGTSEVPDRFSELLEWV